MPTTLPMKEIAHGIYNCFGVYGYKPGTVTPPATCPRCEDPLAWDWYGTWNQRSRCARCSEDND